MARIPRLTWAGGPGEDPGGPVEIWLDPAQARHGVKVLRLGPGDLVEVAGPAGLALARVTTAQGGGTPRLGLVFCEGWRSSSHPAGQGLAGPEPARPGDFLGQGEPGSSPPANREPPRLGLALISLPRFDWAVEKAAELGAGEIWPLVCERVKPGLARAAPARAERWGRLAEEARKQCGRPRPLVIRPPVTPAELLAAANPRGFFLSPRAAGSAGPPTSPAPWILVGPEGGFSPGEEAAFLAAGLRPWNLGPLTLRSETAALAALVRIEAPAAL